MKCRTVDFYGICTRKKRTENEKVEIIKIKQNMEAEFNFTFLSL